MVSHDKKYNKNLAGYFVKQPHFFDGGAQQKPNRRKCSEQPWQQTIAARTEVTMWDEVTETLCDLDFIQAKACGKMTYDLVKDYHFALEGLPEAQPIREIERKRQERMEKYTRDLIAYAKGEIKELDIPQSVKPWPQEKIYAEVERIKKNPNRYDRLMMFINFLGVEAGNLQKYAHEIPYFTVQQAWNFVKDGSVGELATQRLKDVQDYLILKKQNNRSISNVKPLVLKQLKGHTDWISTLNVTPEGRRAVSGSWDHTLIVWDLKSGEKHSVLKGHTSSVTSVCMTPDGRIAVSGSDDKSVMVWDIETGNSTHILKGHTGSVTAVNMTANGRFAISGSCDKTLIIWDLKSGESLCFLEGHKDEIHAVSITPDGCIAVSGSYDKTLIVWDLEKAEILNIFKGHTTCITAVSVTPDGRLVLSASKDDTLILWDLRKNKILLTIEENLGFINVLCMIADGSRAVSGLDNKLRLWDIETGKLQTVNDHRIIVRSVNLISTGQRVVFGTLNNSIKVLDYETGESLTTLRGHTLDVTSLSVAPDGHRAVSGSNDNNIIVWNLEVGESLYTMKGHKERVLFVSFTPDGRRLLSSSFDGEYILWDIENGEPIHYLKRPVNVSPELLTNSLNDIFEQNIWVNDLMTGERIAFLNGKPEYLSSLHKNLITPDGLIVLTVSAHTIILWDLKSGKSIRELKGHLGNIKSFCLTPDGHSAFSVSEDNTLILWDLKTGEPMHIFKGDFDNVTEMSFTPDGCRIISGLYDDSLEVSDIETGRILGRFCGLNSLFSFGLFGNGSIFVVSEEGTTYLHLGKNLLSLRSGFINVRRFWNFKLKSDMPLTADCPFCGHRFEPKKKYIEIIKGILKDNNIGPEDSPCLKLPREAWDEPGLFSNCPKCGKAIRYNPFLVDNSNKY